MFASPFWPSIYHSIRPLFKKEPQNTENISFALYVISPKHHLIASRNIALHPLLVFSVKKNSASAQVCNPYLMQSRNCCRFVSSAYLSASPTYMR